MALGWTGCEEVPSLLPSPPQQSGLSLWISDQLHPLENVSPALAVFIITCVVIFFTEFASNTATIIIFLPVMSELVRALLGMRGRQGGAPVPPTTQVRNLSPAGGVSRRQPQESLLSSKMCECGKTQIPRKNTVEFFSLKKCIIKVNIFKVTKWPSLESFLGRYNFQVWIKQK